MGIVVKNEKSENKLFQFTVFSNGEKGFTVRIKKFQRLRDGRVNYFIFEDINFTLPEFEYFKNWLKTIKKKT